MKPKYVVRELVTGYWLVNAAEKEKLGPYSTQKAADSTAAILNRMNKFSKVLR